MLWNSWDGTPHKRRRDFWTLALRQLNPLASRLSPLRYFADWRVNQYYQRTLTDLKLAREWAAHHLEGLNVRPRAAVLDHGCGRGRHTALLSQLGFQVSAQDIESHAWWRKLPQCFFQKVPPSAPRLPWRDQAFNLVLDVGIIHYLTDEQLTVLANEVFRVLTPGGHWLLLEPNDESYGAYAMRRIIGHLHSVESARTVVAGAGFHEVDLTYEAFYAPVFPLFVNFVRNVARPGPMDLSDFHSTLAARIPDRRRGFWRLRLIKPLVSGR